ncbi:MAG: three-Cys-motif partner protein TcmP [Nitrospiraceae bacterium]|nr:three-Cys-motif partner protein TcmP [Nitrospiraceae bacterium]
MGQTKNFFKEKKSWSIVKDRVLDYYLKPYTSKVLRTGKPIIICDCFAGKGKFDDGENGSPLLIAEQIKSHLLREPIIDNKIQGVFIEKKYHDELKTNLSGYTNVTVYPGSYEDNLKKILLFDNNNNLFLYIDPYGIKSLDLSSFTQIKNRGFNSVEMLMNFNSAGFLREGCRLLTYEDSFTDEDLTDYEIDDDINTKEKMNAIAGGDYWQEILKTYYNGQINIYTAEEQFFAEYSKRVNQLFKYTVNIPIKLKSTNLPKYRLIFGSNHEDGLILMADNMNKKWNEIVEIQRRGQQVLFDYEFPDMTRRQGFDLQNDILRLVSAKSEGILLKNLIVVLIQKYGMSFPVKHYNDKIVEMERKGIVRIERYPSVTKTGKPVKSMNYDDYKITVRIR